MRVRSINIVLLAGFICTIIGGAWTNPTSSHVDTGYSLRNAGNILFLCSNVVVIFLVIFMRHRSVLHDQRNDPILLQLFIVLPIMLVRIIYATVQSYLSGPDNPGANVWVYFSLLLLLDFFATAIFTVAGITMLRRTHRALLERKNAEHLQQGGTYGIQSVPGQNSDLPKHHFQQRFKETSSGQYEGRGPLRKLFYSIKAQQQRGT